MKRSIASIEDEEFVGDTEPKHSAIVDPTPSPRTKREPAGTGLIKNTLKDGSITWSFRYYDSREGRTVWGGTFHSEDEADRARLKARTASKGGSLQPGKLTVAGYAAEWPDSHPEGRGPSTLTAYRYGVKRFVDEFGSVKLRKLQRSKLKEWARGQKRWAIAPAQAMLHDMWDDELIAANPMLKIKLPAEQGRENYPILSTEEVWKLIEIARSELDPDIGSQIAGIIATCAFLGTRISETLALGAKTLDGAARIIYVNRQVSSSREFKLPKQRKTRDIALHGYLSRAWSEIGIDPSSTLLFRPKRAPLFLYNNFNRYFRDVAKASGVKGLTVHELRRHTCQWLLKLQIPEWAANYHVGHNWFETEMRRLYTNPEQEARELVHAALDGVPEPLPTQGRWEFDPSLDQLALDTSP